MTPPPSPDKHTRKGSGRKDQKRVRQSLQRATKLSQHARQFQRDTQYQNEKRRENAENVMYARGSFNKELEVTPHGRKRPLTSNDNPQSCKRAKKKKTVKKAKIYTDMGA